MKDRFYITTSIMYTNAQPHIGFVLELVQADMLARYRRMMGDEVRFLTGTDEHGTKIARAAESAGTEPQMFVDDITAQVSALIEKLDVSNDDFIRTTDRERHWPGALSHPHGPGFRHRQGPGGLGNRGGHRGPGRRSAHGGGERLEPGAGLTQTEIIDAIQRSAGRY